MFKFVLVLKETKIFLRSYEPNLWLGSTADKVPRSYDSCLIVSKAATKTPAYINAVWRNALNTSISVVWIQILIN
jgi:hypothetical protein